MMLFSEKRSIQVTEKEVEEVKTKEEASLTSKIATIFRAKSHPPRIILQPRKIYQTQNGKNFNIDISLHSCINGYLSWDRKQAASLIVFNVQFVCIGTKGSFNRIKMTVDFENQETPSGNAQPAVIASAPFVFEEKQKASQTKVQTSNKVENVAYTDINLVGGKGGVKHTESTEKVTNTIQHYYGKGSSGTICNDAGTTTGIWWNVKKSSNPDAKDDAGIDSNYRFAVLVARQSNATFHARMKLLVDAGWRFRAENRCSHVSFVKGESPSLIFDPQTWYEGDCAGIDRKRLGQFLEKKKMAALSKISR